MDHPYLYPDEAPWTEDYQDLMAMRKVKRYAYTQAEMEAMTIEQELYDDEHPYQVPGRL